MNVAFNFAADPLLTALGLALVNFVWQGAVIGLVCAALLRLAGNARPQTRYAISCAAMTLCLVLPLQAIINHSSDHAATSLLPITVNEFNPHPLTNTKLFLLWNWLQAHLQTIVASWAICVTLFSIRLALGLAWVAQIADPRRSAANPQWQATLNRLAQRNGLKRSINLRVVNDLTSPAVAGWLRPVILMPAALLTGMSPDLLEALLAHEVAHIQRMDYLVNLLQSGVETLLFYHPAVWWISKQIRIEREQIADDLAAQMLGEPRRLALALVELERVQFSSSGLSVAANGGNLIDRIQRLTHPAVRPLGYKAFVPVISLVFAGIAFYANAATDATTTGAAAAPAAKIVKAIVNFKTCPKPEYPKQSLANKDEGTVHMSFQIDQRGHIAQSKIEQSSGHVELDEAAMTALNKCSFTPGTLNGKPVVSPTFVDYVWKLPN